MGDIVPGPVITATPTIMDGLVVCWRASVHGPSLLSASRDHLMIHGTVDLATIAPWLDDARRVHEALKAGRGDEAAALATHEYDRPFGHDLVPIERKDQ